MTLLNQNAPKIQQLGIGRFSAVGWILALLPLSIFVALLNVQNEVVNGNLIQGSIPWIPSLGVALSWQIDGLSLLFGLLISGIGALVLVYASGYLAGDKQLGRFYLYLLIFMAAMLGLVFSANLLMLFIFWELTSISSYLLIGYKHRYQSSRSAALQALLVTGGGGLAFLAGILLLAQVAGTLEIDQLAAQSQMIQEHPFYLAIILLMLLGAFTKSAQFPFHFWLPNAMAAPTPVSAYLHSATMVKAGVYLVARMTPVLGNSALWFGLLTTVGAITMIVAAFLAWHQTDLKRILAYTTISALGTLMLLLGVGTSVALKAAMVFLVAHALYKGALFMIAGAVEHQTGSRDIRQLGGLWRVMPLTALSAALAGLSMSGIPPFTGFVSKELFYESTLYTLGAGWILTGAALVTNILTVVAAAMAVIRPFIDSQKSSILPSRNFLEWSGKSRDKTFLAKYTGQRTAEQGKISEASMSLWLGPIVLAGAGLVSGLFIGTVGTEWIAPAASAVAGDSIDVKLSLWHGINPMLLLSGLTIVLAGLVWVWQEKLLAVTSRINIGRQIGPERGYLWLLGGLPQFAVWVGVTDYSPVSS
ncbi:MAG: proton-conducting transporter membrane subunit [Chloroflexota bacterium]